MIQRLGTSKVARAPPAFEATLSFQGVSGSIAHAGVDIKRVAPLDLGGPVESSAAIEIAKHTLLSGGLILAIGTLTGLLAQKIKIPDVALFLIVGMAIGPEVSGLINIKADSALNQIILLFGASYILFDGEIGRAHV